MRNLLTVTMILFAVVSFGSAAMAKSAALQQKEKELMEASMACGNKTPAAKEKCDRVPEITAEIKAIKAAEQAGKK